MNTLTYKGYHATIEFDARDAIFVGNVIGLRAVVSFHGTSIRELRAAFKESVEDYLEYCRAQKIDPERPVSGRLLLRLPVELHQQAVLRAEAEGLSLNQWVVDQLRDALRQRATGTHRTSIAAR